MESWKNTQKTLQYLWDCSDSSYSKYDERTEHFRYYNIFNPLSCKIENRKMIMQSNLNLKYQACSYTLIGLVIISMIIYRQLVLKYSPETDVHGAITQSLTQEIIVMNVVIRVVYAVIIIIFGAIYKALALK